VIFDDMGEQKGMKRRNIDTGGGTVANGSTIKEQNEGNRR